MAGRKSTPGTTRTTGADFAPLTKEYNSKSKKRYAFRGRMPDGTPNPIDVHVGQRIYMRRKLLGLSQEGLALLLGITFQQIQKYEHGINRIGASRLWDICNVLNVPFSFFFDDMPPEIATHSPRKISGMIKKEKVKEITIDDPMSRAETYELVTAFYKIGNREIAENLRRLIILLSKSGMSHL